MSRDISATNLAEINASHLQPVTMVKMEFGTPVYAHSGIGTLTYDGNDYLGVGAFGSINSTKESESLTPSPLTLSLSGVDSSLIAGALDSGSYGDGITIYEGYRQDDGTLVDDPWIVWKGTLEFSNISLGAEGAISITVKHDLAVLIENDGGRFTDEDQQLRFTGDVAFEFVTDMPGLQLEWAAQRAGSTTPGGSPREGYRIN